MHGRSSLFAAATLVGSFAPDGREIYFSRSRLGTLVTRWGPHGWTAPERIDFIDEEHLTEEANLTPDGLAVVF